MGTLPTDAVDVQLTLVPGDRANGIVHVEGTVRAGDGDERPFSGWMALLELLEAFVLGARAEG